MTTHIFPKGRVFTTFAPDGLDFFCYLPEVINPTLNPLIVVHGLSRNAAEQAFRFANFASKYGVPIIAPLFSAETHRHFQQLSVGAHGVRADTALIAMLDFAEAALNLNLKRPSFFGYSGGGQFVHRFAMLYPDRVASTVLFAPGWYTFPDDQHSFPYGIRVKSGNGFPTLNIDRFCRIPTQVLVGTKDIARDASLNREAKIDRLQGKNRLERARRWVDAIQSYAVDNSITANVSLSEIDGASHSFKRNVEKFSLIETVFSSLYGEHVQGTKHREMDALRSN